MPKPKNKLPKRTANRESRLEIDGLDVVEIAYQAEDLTGVIGIVGVVLQGVDSSVIDEQSSALVGHTLALHHIDYLLRNSLVSPTDRLDAGYISIFGRNENSAGRCT